VPHARPSRPRRPPRAGRTPSTWHRPGGVRASSCRCPPAPRGSPSPAGPPRRGRAAVPPAHQMALADDLVEGLRAQARGEGRLGGQPVLGCGGEQVAATLKPSLGNDRMPSSPGRSGRGAWGAGEQVRARLGLAGRRSPLGCSPPRRRWPPAGRCRRRSRRGRCTEAEGPQEEAEPALGLSRGDPECGEDPALDVRRWIRTLPEPSSQPLRTRS